MFTSVVAGLAGGFQPEGEKFDGMVRNGVNRSLNLKDRRVVA